MLGFHKPLDFHAHGLGFQLWGFLVPAFAIWLHHQEPWVKHPRLSLGEGCAWIEGCLAVIGDVPDIRFHHPIEHGVDKIQHLRAAAEIFVQVNPLAAALLLGVRAVFFHEEFRPGHAETVDALLHIPYHKNITGAFGFPGNGL